MELDRKSAYSAFLSLLLLASAASAGVALHDDGVEFPDGTVQTTAAPAAGVSTPVRCRIWINSTLTSQNVPMDCRTPDETSFVNVPAGFYLYVTDIVVRARLTSQTEYAASVRIWRESLGVTGCMGGSVVGDFVTDFYLAVNDGAPQEHVPFQTPYLILTENDCLAVYTSTPSGCVVEVSGFLWDQLAAPQTR